MNGKNKCKILKDIRRQIARENDIEYVTSECKFQGNCSGTCPKCEAELRYLEDELKKRQKAGKAVAVAGIAAALMIGSVGCTPDNGPGNSVDGDIVPESSYEETQTDPSVEEPGGVPVETMELMGEPADTEPPLMGDLPLE